MNDFTITIAWLIVQVTVVALGGLVLAARAGRRRPGAGAAAALTALAATLGLAAVACCPLPSWWTWEAVMPITATDEAADFESPDAMPAPSTDVMPLLLALLRHDGRSPAVEGVDEPPAWRWPAILPTIVVGGAIGGIMHLLAGLWALQRGQRRSRRLQEPHLAQQVDELCAALGVRRPVTVCESPDLATAATIGWRRPTVLLPSGWRSWTEAQCRAAVAHELAHVGRADFAGWLLARLSVAVHFWHPLVRLLARHFQLQQELAADALAAPLAGGVKAYRRALVELALRADRRAHAWRDHAWPAPAFLSHTGILLRRIAMLRVMDDSQRRPASRRARWFTFSVLAALTLAVSAWRFPMPDALAGDARTGGPEAPAADVVPFDLTLLGPSEDGHRAALKEGEPTYLQDGVYGIRPAALLDRPGTEPIRKLINEQLDVATAAFLKDGFGIHIEDVEQVVGRVHFGGTNAPGKRSLMMSANVLRTTRDIDWVKLRDRCGKVFTQHQYQGETFVSFSMPEMLRGMFGGKGNAYLWAADARTLVFDTDSNIKRVIDSRKGGRKLPVPEYAAGWEKVSRGLFAMALDNRDGRIIKRCITKEERDSILADTAKAEYHALRFCDQVSAVVVGVAGADDFRFDLRASAPSPETAATLAEHCKGIIAALRKEQSEEASDAKEHAFVLKALERPRIHVNGSAVTVHAEVASGFNALIAEYLSALPDHER
jgi:beta-lactamase regulating signal transducer with metallopeptidase domain